MKTKNQFSLLLILGTLASFGPMAIDMYLPAFPTMAQDFGSDIGEVQLSLTTFLAGLAVGQLIYGPISDRVGRKMPLLFGIGLFLIASVFCSFASSALMLMIMRFFQALGSCVGMVMTRAIVRDLFTKKEASRIYSLITLVMGLAPILAPLIGGQILLFASWRVIFWVLFLFGLMSFLMVLFYLPETHKPNPNVILRQSFLSYFSFFKEKNFLSFVLISSFSSAGMFAYITGSPFVFIEFFEIPAQYYGFIFGSNAVGLVFFSQINGKLVKTIEVDTLLKWPLVVAFLAGMILLVSAIFGGLFWPTVIALFLFISTLGFIGPNSTASAMDSQGDRAGVASAFFGAMQFVIAAVISGMVGVFANGTPAPMSYILAFCTCVAFIIYFSFNLKQFIMRRFCPLNVKF